MEQYLSDQNQLHIFDNDNFSISCKNADLSAVDNFSIISPTPTRCWSSLVPPYYYLSEIVYPIYLNQIGGEKKPF